MSDMTRVQGNWFDGKTSSQILAYIDVDLDGVVNVFDNGRQQLLIQSTFSELKISSRVGATPRYLFFPAGEKFETRDNDKIDFLLNQFRPSIFNTLAHSVESNLRFVLVTVLLVIGIIWGSVQFGFPAIAKTIAYKLPQSAMDRAASESLALLDKTQFSPSTLDASVQARVLRHFDQAIKEHADLLVHVIFRHGGDIGANAFALPDGTVVFTDEIITLAKNDDELLAVFAHEIGHVRYRHALRAAIQGSILSFIVSMLTGDMSAAAGFLSSLPLIVTTLSYSRDFEREADEHALHFLDTHKIPRHYFVDLMERLSYESRCNTLLAVTDGTPKTNSRKSLLDRLKKLMLSKNTKVEKTPESSDSKGSDSKGSDSKDSGSKPTSPDENATQEKMEPRLTPEMTEEQKVARKAQCDQLIKDNSVDEKILSGYFSTHPATEERLKKFRDSP
jgi:Zn-dependent protease with chaperone function